MPIDSVIRVEINHVGKGVECSVVELDLLARSVCYIAAGYRVAP